MTPYNFLGPSCSSRGTDMAPAHKSVSLRLFERFGESSLQQHDTQPRWVSGAGHRISLCCFCVAVP